MTAAVDDAAGPSAESLWAAGVRAAEPTEAELDDWELAGAPPDAVPGEWADDAMSAAFRIANRAAWSLARWIWEASHASSGSTTRVTDRRRPGKIPAASLGWSEGYAASRIEFARQILRRLPRLGEEMESGRLEEHKAWIFTSTLADLDDEQAREVVDRLVDKAPGWAYRQLREKVESEAKAVDPGWAEARRAAAIARRRVAFSTEPSGAAALRGLDLPLDPAQDSHDRIVALAVVVADRLNALGREATKGQIEAAVFLTLTGPEGAGLWDEDVVELVVAAFGPDGSGEESGPDDGGPDGGGPDDGGPHDGGPHDGGPGHGDTGGPDDGSADDGPGEGGPDDDGPHDCGSASDGPNDSVPDDRAPDDSSRGDSGPDDSGPGGRSPGDDAGDAPLDDRRAGHRLADHRARGREDDAEDEPPPRDGAERRPGPAEGAEEPERWAAPFVARVAVRVGLRTVLGLDRRPGSIPGRGSVCSSTARSLAWNRVDAHWRLLLYDSEGRLEWVLVIQPPRAGRPGAGGRRRRHVVELTAYTHELDELTATFRPDAGPREEAEIPGISVGAPRGVDVVGGHVLGLVRRATRALARARARPADEHPAVSTADAHRRMPRAELRLWVQCRDMTCRAPGCATPAVGSDVDHTWDHALGGPTEAGNLGPFCGSDHAFKHDRASGWTVVQSEPGRFDWTAPTGRRHTITAEPYDPLPDPVAPADGSRFSMPSEVFVEVPRPRQPFAPRRNHHGYITDAARAAAEYLQERAANRRVVPDPEPPPDEEPPF